MLLNILRLLGLNKTILYVIIGRGSSVLVGALTLFIISRYLSPLEQGYYFSFLSVIAFQVVLELGLGVILTQFISHEMSDARILGGKLVGSERTKQRVSSIIRLTLKWYSIVGVVIVVFLAPSGYFFFKNSVVLSNSKVSFALPWFFLVFSSALSLITNAILSIGDGLGYVEKIAKMRASQTLIAGGITASFLIGGFGLYSTSSASLSIILCGGIWIIKNISGIIICSYRKSGYGECISWKKEIFPMQWRIALSWLSGYFIFQILNPISFKYFGPEFSGKLGMSMTVTNLILTLSLAWITTKIPDYGRRMAVKDKTVYPDFCKAFYQSIFFFVFLSLSASFFLWGLSTLKYDMATRFLSPKLFLVICLSMLASHIVACQAVFVRTHKIEKHTWLSLGTAIVFIAVIIFACKFLYAEYLVYSYASVSWFVYLPWSYFVFRRFLREYKYVRHIH